MKSFTSALANRYSVLAFPAGSVKEGDVGGKGLLAFTFCHAGDKIPYNMIM